MISEPMSKPERAARAPALTPECWMRVETVLLDLDGTLLDLAFDNYFWRERVPAAYAAARAISPTCVGCCTLLTSHH